MQITFYDHGSIADEELKYAVIVAKSNDGWIFVKHKERSAWEIPGGRREINEAIEETARRELYEETGALSFDLYPLCIYSVKRTNSDESFGSLYYAEVSEIGDIPGESEIGQTIVLNDIPNELTYPEIQPTLYSKALQMLAMKSEYRLKDQSC